MWAAPEQAMAADFEDPVRVAADAERQVVGSLERAQRAIQLPRQDLEGRLHHRSMQVTVPRTYDPPMHIAGDAERQVIMRSHRHRRSGDTAPTTGSQRAPTQVDDVLSRGERRGAHAQ